MSFQSFKKSIKKILHSIKYGDEHRLPLVYLKTDTNKPSSYYSFPPNDILDEPLSSYREFPKLSKEILLSLFSSIGVYYVPEIALFELNSKTPQNSFKDFCLTFGLKDDNLIDSSLLNRVIKHLIEMDTIRRDNLFDSRPIYRALANRDFEEVNRLINERRIIDDKDAF